MNKPADALLSIACDAQRFADDDIIAAVDAGLDADLDHVARRYDEVCLSTCTFGFGAKSIFAALLLTRHGGTIDKPRRVLTVWWEPSGTRVVRH